jgi:hypothetical protein
VEGYKINIQKSVAFQYSRNEQTEKEISASVPIIIASKISWDIFNKELFIENYVTEERHQRRNQKMERYPRLMDW